MMNPRGTFQRHYVGKNSVTLRRTVCALLVAAPGWFSAFNQPPAALPWFAPPSRAEAAGIEVTGASPDDAVEFYQYTDTDGVIHFVDSRAKIPRRYQDRVIVRKDLPAARQTTRVVIADNQIRVPVSFKNGDKTVQAILLLDTGASITSITEELAARLNIDIESARLVSMGVADGRMINIHVTKVDEVAVGDRMKSPLEVGVLPPFASRELHDGYLGLDFLSGFQYQIDVENSLIRWR